ncbi:urea ABC transporter permease subunit UrtC [Microvirga tunisiensis]|uniref:Urea ABC transporter permease subunit UrtC n=2 Tax=Pannonibacter tanglangensis TaxID=2750084 RepID=A0ABW9ZJU6_9HYPH|nr:MULTISPECIES: urea ABC transporter permease subunit UrtC [unclassified Pannonibacter]NBN65150.1 urea ABC transporter permease subunit UrtC [Pannonibacter sp. XCT-34]NBN79872.1 urea ABC transporter permease subunit UrtC [Pannonibacter sp. XCT-53]
MAHVSSPSARLPDSVRDGRLQIAVYAAVCLLIFLVPLAIDDDFLLNRIARYLVLGMVAMALALSWGYAGILNLGQALSFGLGSYCMAMALKLRTVPVHTGSEGLPDFMVWNNVERLPLFWVPFQSMTFAILAGILVPVLVAAALGWFMFRGRITGVFVAIITLAALVVANLLIVDMQSVTGGFNGITDLAQLDLFGFEFDAYSATTYYLVATCLTVSLFGCLAVTRSKAGLIFQAIRDDERRVRFFGYDVAAFKILAMAVSAAVAGLAGMLYTVVMEFASPTFLGVPLSLSIVIWCAVGGRQSLLGAMLGAILIAGMQGALSETEAFLDTWTLVMGATFVLVVLFLPNGLAGLVTLIRNRLSPRPKASSANGLRPALAEASTQKTGDKA